VQFSDDETGRAAKARIENLLAGALQSTRSTHTY
jgi:Tfp pilus assembly protein PilZ